MSPPTGSCGSLRLRSGSTSFLHRESAEGCLLLGCEREKVRDHLAEWARLWEWEPGRVGWFRPAGACSKERSTNPTPEILEKQPHPPL